jgi:hypothetical protein
MRTGLDVTGAGRNTDVTFAQPAIVTADTIEAAHRRCIVVVVDWFRLVISVTSSRTPANAGFPTRGIG